MRNLLLIFWLLSLLTINVTAQNLLSPTWKIWTNVEHTDIENLDPANGQEVNLLLSWERQGYSWMDNNCVVKNSFYVEEETEKLLLEFSLQAEISAVYINNEKLAGGIGNSFWSDRGKKTSLAIPDSILKKDAENTISIVLSGLSYTGGLSHNNCSVYAVSSEYTNRVELEFPTSDHVFLKDIKQEFRIKTKHKADHVLHLMVKSDLHKSYIDKKISMTEGMAELVFDLTAYDLEPGLYECVVISSNQTYCGTVEWFAIQPEEIECSNYSVDDFDAFWQVAREELNTIEPKFNLYKVDSLCSPARDGYIVEMQSLDDLTIRGYYFVPKSKGSHPVVLQVPGYGYGFAEDLPSFINRKSDVAELLLCVRGHGISADVFNPWPEMTLWAVGICNKEEAVYRSMYMDCVRAVEFLLSRPEIDPDRIGVAGGSQGGALSLATAALCSEDISACAIFDPFLCDIRHQAEIRIMVKKEFQDYTKLPGVDCEPEQMFATQDYIDTKGFASKITCPVYFAAALFDDDCPVHCGFSAYNLINSQKRYEVFPNDSHLGESGEYGYLFTVIEELFRGEVRK